MTAHTISSCGSSAKPTSPLSSHLTCVCHNLNEMSAILDRYSTSGIENILALSGDPPKNSNHDRAKDAFRYAEELVRYVRSCSGPNGRGFGIGVAGFPKGTPAARTA